MKEVKTKIPKRVVSRRNLPKFGDAKEGEDNVTLNDKTIITMDHPDDNLIEEQEDPTMKNTLASFIQKQQERSLNREIYDSDLMPESEAGLDHGDANKGGGLSGIDERFASLGSGGAGKYVPPGRGLGGGPGGDARTSRDDRGGGMDRGDRGGSNQSGDENTLRISNLTKAVSEDDLKDLFSKFGNVTRVYLPRIERTEGGKTFKEPKGFAFITYMNKDDAESALERLNGHGYDHLILKVEWAKPNKEGGSGGGPPGGDSMRYASGYGKQLAQDTKEKVSYASNLTGNR